MAGIWPGSTKTVALLSFDFDGTSIMRYRNADAENRPTALSIGEFGPKVGVHRILDLLDRYEIPASFFVPGWIAERNEDTVRRMVSDGHEVGHHGYMHEPPATLDPGQEQAVLDKGIEILEGITGERPRGYRSPSWDLTEHSLGFLAQRGFVYDSSLMGHDAPYFVGSPNGRLVELPVSWALDDYPYYVFNPGMGSMNTPADVFEGWRMEFDGAYQYGGAFILTMHPQVTGRLAKMMVLERLIQYIRTHSDVVFMRHIDVAQRWTEAGMV
ncbi:MAG TPA: polysaccharide deacetylase [SAR202 cluster bacterium]|nr:polysaccharide deacetylase [SAR202 cluster bacterium]